MRRLVPWLICTAFACGSLPAKHQAGPSSRIGSGGKTPGLSAFLVLTNAGAVEVRSSKEGTSRRVIPHADSVLYDPALELIWYIEKAQLRVLDLRAPDDAPVVLARGMQDIDSIAVRRGTHAVSPHDSCDGSFGVLNWTAEPTLVSDEGDAVPLEGRGWLQAQHSRSARKLPPRSFFLDDKVALPEGLAECEDEETCGTSVLFGNRGWQLVLVTQTNEGDCPVSACLLRDPQSGQFATPPSPGRWGQPGQVPAGSCGPYFFDELGEAALVDSSLCVAGKPCTSVHGTALGWLTPGPIIGY
jgi:hypothetical protein